MAGAAQGCRREAQLAQHLHAFWACRGPFGDIRRVLASLAQSAPEKSLSRARLLWAAAVMALNQNDHDSCAELSEESLHIGTETKDAEVVAWSLLVGAIPRWISGDLTEAIRGIDSAVALARLMHLGQVELEAWTPCAPSRLRTEIQTVPSKSVSTACC